VDVVHSVSMLELAEMADDDPRNVEAGVVIES